MIKKSVKIEIDKIIKDVWLEDICEDYGNGLLIKEASLQCALYHHLRLRLADILEKNNLYIYPEFYFKDLKYRADLVIVEMDMDMQTSYLSSRVTDIASVIELKYDGGTAKTTEKYIKSDLPKLRQYFQSLPYKCQLYFGVIFETECKWLYWFDKRTTQKWGNGWLTELNAGRMDDETIFEVNSYNGMNYQHRSKTCEIEFY